MSSQILTDYYEAIIKKPLMSRDEENALFDVIYGGKASPKEVKRAKDRLIEANLRFVFKRAKILSDGNPAMFEELIGAGNEGLLVALEKFNPDREIRFLSYAGWWVRQRQLKEMSKMRLVALPIWKQQLSVHIAREQEKLGRPLRDNELQEKFPTHKLKDLRELNQTRYLTYYFEDEEEDKLTDQVIESRALTELEVEDILSTCEKLTETERQVICMLYGLDDGEEKTVAEVASQLSLTKEQVRVCRDAALKRLRAHFEG